MRTGAIFTLSSTDTTSKQTLCISILTTLKGKKSHEGEQHIFFNPFVTISIQFQDKRGYKNEASFKVKPPPPPPTLFLSNPLYLPLSLCLTISLSLCSLLKCEMDLSWSLSTWFPREPRESFESDLQWRWCWLLYSTVGTDITTECHVGNVPAGSWN